MPGIERHIKRHALAMPALLIALLAAGCSNRASFDAPAPSSGTSTLGSFFTNSSAKAPQTVAGAQPDVNCPPVEVRRGASTLTVTDPGQEASALTLRYQGSFERQARECSVAEGSLVMRVGIEGRIVVGPRGGPGQIDVPVRLAVVQEVPGGMRPIMTRFAVIPTTVAPGAGYGTFSHVEEGISFPLPTPTSQLDSYIVYVGFDPASAQAQKKPPPKSRPKPAPAASAN